ncbi:MAG TPA: signal peptidase I [Fimbriimonadaceae bacterium]|nr:signal peptidase I [Fimbriimonadaceae bacterium]
MVRGMIAQVAEPPGLVDRFADVTPRGVLLFAALLTVIRVLFVLSRNDPSSTRLWRRIAEAGGYVMEVLVFAVIGVFFIVRPFLVQSFFIPSPSMVPTLLVRDFVLANKLVYRFSEPRVGDIAVFQPPEDALLPGQARVDFVKRIVGAPGDVVEIRQGKLFRNGQAAQEPFLPERPYLEDFKLVAYDGVRSAWKGQTIPVFLNPDGLGNYLTTTAPRFSVGFAPDRGFLPLDETTAEDRQVMRELATAPPAPIPPDCFLMMGDNRNSSYDGRSWGLVRRDAIIGRCEFVWFPLSRIRGLSSPHDRQPSRAATIR